MQLTFTLDELPAVAEKFWQENEGKKVFSFHGNMGAGKTTFIMALAKAKKVKNTISSPTYSIINEYGYDSGKIYHMDLYRLKDTEEAIQAGVEDALYSGNICLVEWPERAVELFPDDNVNVYLEVVNGSTRNISIK
ncbi:tRNA (adenosine(37)-N6)-threonylcarbamoyltransferase complex ATPase subunit type 1 TsaE [Pinibacter soli]|uniref:tRNA threonylcarbamoyladenosine biosynthesis protein TsaE n=1 Tax=Pinibacter soli TaxID=3044211 RepID=A0ABT6RAK2_9BACT|nr:tRNA (adenosine(37)-N6)-threonylcarbamoyltransferase complex ATPase subunit type 1 TsaE [Pinibacter soli]MDI3318914.1 tRNA (adenosine(37)-N6)-threonylcarbamoyltransferase complex ATPase subunit type 1 TsaE [Pinibacter soli]